MGTGKSSRKIVLDGNSLTIDDIKDVAAYFAKVEIADDARLLMERSRQFVLTLANIDTPIYGFNRGVGLNKDRVVETSSFELYNRNLLYSHSAGVEPYASEEQVRAVMLARLNTLLVGRTGVDPEIANQYADFLNAGIHPLVPLRGSVGAGDITLLSHIGQAFIGEGDVMYRGTRVSAEAAIAEAGLKPVQLGAKDGLAIVSSNALSAGTGALVLYESERLLELADIVFALSLEGLQGHVSPLDESVLRYRPYEGLGRSVQRVRSYLRDSGLWQKESGGSLQDPLSFRSACHIHGAALDALKYVKDALLIQLNSSDDNPCVLEEEGRIVSCANFEPLAWVIGFELLGIALSHISRSSCYRTIKLSTPAFTGLSRFLSPNESTIAYGTIQKTFTALDAEIRHLSNPASVDYYSLAGDFEDHGSNAPFVVHKTGEILDRLYYVLAIEAIHAIQAIDLRNNIKLGLGTQAAYLALRSEVPFLSEDRSLTADIQAAYEVLKGGKLIKEFKPAGGSL